MAGRREVFGSVGLGSQVCMGSGSPGLPRSPPLPHRHLRFLKHQEGDSRALRMLGDPESKVPLGLLAQLLEEEGSATAAGERDKGKCAPRASGCNCWPDVF